MSQRRTWAYRLRNWIGTYVVKSSDNGQTWQTPVPVNVLPLKHAGTRLGCWQLRDGSILMGVYGRIRGYGEEGEGFVRIALVENEQRIRQAARNVRKYLASMGVNTGARSA